MAMKQEFVTFRFPDQLPVFSELVDTDVCIVSIIGKSHLKGNKTSAFFNFLDRNSSFINSSNNNNLKNGEKTTTSSSSTTTSLVIIIIIITIRS